MHIYISKLYNNILVFASCHHLSPSPTALFPAASRMKRGGSVMSPMFHKSFQDVHLLFEVRIRELETHPWKWPPLIPFYSPDHAVWCTLSGQWRVFRGRR